MGWPRRVWAGPGGYGLAQEGMGWPRRVWAGPGGYGLAQEGMGWPRRVWAGPGGYGPRPGRAIDTHVCVCE